ncbi:MAG TPA: glucose-6-phosphate dehydrogenase assembly protein OpcA [Pyrinomonadaceae bacterium]|nr:glucose-6-phosphate dehydrogenase assembly protein OpcA [Pyrinomonadaceae bacterium]
MQQISLGKTLDIEVVERELASLWHVVEPAPNERAAAADADEVESPVLRARAANLLVYVANQTTLAEVHQLLPELTATHPSRVLAIFGDDPAPDQDIEMYVAAFSQQEKGPKRLCCEEVTLKAQGSFISELPSAALPLLVSDLPTFLWWRASLGAQRRVFDSLFHAADRLIIDSVEFAQPIAELKAVNNLYAKQPEVGISDLNWARLTSWRGLLADFYDVAAYQSGLNAIDHVSIHYVSPKADADAIAPQALLMAGWLASRLKWTISESSSAKRKQEQISFEFHTAAQRSITVELVRVSESSIRPGRLALVELRAPDEISFGVERSKDGQLVIAEAKLGGGVQRGRVLPVRNRSTAQLLTREMEILCNDRIYQEALVVAATMIEKL